MSVAHRKRHARAVLSLVGALIVGVMPSSTAALTPLYEVSTVRYHAPEGAGGYVQGRAICATGGYRAVSGGALWVRRGQGLVPGDEGPNQLTRSQPILYGESRVTGRTEADGWEAAGVAMRGDWSLLVVAMCVPRRVLGGAYQQVTEGISWAPGRIELEGRSGGTYLACPRGQRTVTGGAEVFRGEALYEGHLWEPDVTLVQSTATSDQRGWYASGMGVNGKIRVRVLCRPARGIQFETSRSVDLAMKRGEHYGAYVTCPKGTMALSGGAFWHTSKGGLQEGSRLGRIVSSSITTDGRGWYASGARDDFMGEGSGQPKVAYLTVRVDCIADVAIVPGAGSAPVVASPITGTDAVAALGLEPIQAATEVIERLKLAIWPW